MSLTPRIITVASAACLLSVSTFSFAQDAQPKKETRLAVVDVGKTDKTPIAFQDFLAVAFAKQPGIALLERAEVDRLLREQALNLSLANPIESKTAVQAGKLWAVDAFLMLEAAKPPKGSISVRIRLVDAHHGMKVLDANLLLEADAKQYPEQADTLAKVAGQKLAGFTKDAKGLRLVGVAALQSQEVSKSWDWLSEALAAGVEQHLGLEPSVILMERAKTRTLTDERTLAAGLPEALKASAVLVTGSFKLNRDKGLDALTVTIQCRAGGKVVLERKVEGSLNQPSVIAQMIAKEIAKGLPGGASASRSMPADAEAKMLADQARAFYTAQNVGPTQSWSNDPEQALAPAEAALALVPASNEYRYLLLTILDAQLSRRAFEKGIKQRWQHALAYCTRAIPLAEQMLAHADKKMPSDWPHKVMQVFYHHYNSHEVMVFGKQWSDEDEDAARAVRQGLKSLYARRAALPAQATDFADAASRIGWTWCETPEEALSFRLEAVAQSSVLFKRKPANSGMPVMIPDPSFYQHFTQTPQWAKRRDLEAIYLGHLEALRKHKDPLVNLSGELASGAFGVRPGSKPDFERARAHYKNFVSTLKSEVQPQTPGGAYSYHFWVYVSLARARFAADAKQDAEIKAGFAREVLDYFLAEPGRFQQLKHWKDCLEFYSVQLEAAGKEDEAYRHLQNHGQRLKGVKLAVGDNADVITDVMAKLARRHARLRPADAAPNPYLAQAIFQFKDLNGYLAAKPWAGSKDVHLRRLILDDKVAAVVCTLGIGRKERFGLLRLDPATLKPVSFAEYPVDFTMDSKWAINDYEFEGPPVIAVGADVYVGSPYGGIICFPNQGPAKGWTEKTGLASNQIRSLAFLDGKLYAATGAYYSDRGLIDLDLATGKSTILFSSKAKDSPRPLDGRPILAVAADAKRQCLWLGVRAKPLGNGSVDKGALFTYDPKTQKTIKKMDAERGVGWFALHKGKLLMGAHTYAVALDLHTEELTALIDGDVPGYTPFSAPRKLDSGTFGACRMLLPVGPTLLYRDSIKPSNPSLFVMAAGDKKPRSILEKCFPDQPDRCWVHDLAMSRQGLLLLTSSGLYVSPGISPDDPKREVLAP